MSTKNEIKAKYLALHDALGARKDAADKELFDQQHRQVWTDCDTELKARRAELAALASHSDVEKQELRELEDMFPTPVPSRNLAAEIDELKAKVAQLERSR